MIHMDDSYGPGPPIIPSAARAPSVRYIAAEWPLEDEKGRSSVGRGHGH